MEWLKIGKLEYLENRTELFYEIKKKFIFRFKWHILRSFHFVVEVTFNSLSCIIHFTFSILHQFGQLWWNQLYVFTEQSLARMEFLATMNVLMFWNFTTLGCCSVLLFMCTLFQIFPPALLPSWSIEHFLSK